jgi:hypothetical protein
MVVAILFELNQELTRLFVAGSRLSAGDPRLKKYLAPLAQYGEKSPVFQKLGALVEGLLLADASESAAKLIETEAFLLSVLSTQGESLPPVGGDAADIGERGEAYARAVQAVLPDRDGQAALPGQTRFGYRELAPVISALRVSGSGRLEILKNAYAKGLFNDPRLTRPAVRALGDRSIELAEYISDTVLPSLGERAYGILLDEYDKKGETPDGRRLTVLHKIRGREMLFLVDEAIANGSITVKVYAVRIMAEYPEYKEALEGLLNESKPVREEAALAIERINKESKKGFLGKLFGKK